MQIEHFHSPKLFELTYTNQMITDLSIEMAIIIKIMTLRN